MKKWSIPSIEELDVRLTLNGTGSQDESYAAGGQDKKNYYNQHNGQGQIDPGTDPS